MTYTVFVCDTVTGLRRDALDCNLKSWARVLNAADDLQTQLNQGTLTKDTKAYYRDLTEPTKNSLVVDWDGVPLAGGPIWNRPPTKGGVAVNASGLQKLFVKRKVANLSTPYANQVFTYTGVSLGTIAQRLVQLATDPGKPGATLPLTYPATEADSDASRQRTYYGYELNNVADMLVNLTGVIGGPDIDFVPEWVDGDRSAIRWRMRIGTMAAPKLTTVNSLAWDSSVPESAVKELGFGDDASQRADVAWSRGDGQDVSTLMARAASTKYTSQGYPLLEDEVDYSTVATQATLDAHAAGDLAAGLDPIVQYSMTVDALSDPRLGSYQLGDIASVVVRDHYWIPDSPPAGYGLRILGISGNASTDVTLTLQPTDSPGLDIIGSPDQELTARVARIERVIAAGDAG